MPSSDPRGASPLGRRLWLGFLLAVLVVGLTVWIVLVSVHDSPVAWQALLVNFMYFTPLSGGLVVWPAIVLLSNGRWDEKVARWGLAGVAFAPLSLLALGVLWIGAGTWAPWQHAAHVPKPGWLDPTFVFVRDLVSLAIFWVLAGVYALLRRRGRRPARLAGALVVTYCLVFSLLGFDLVMWLDPEWVSALFGVYVFISGLYAAVAAWALVTAVTMRRAAPLGDLGQLLLAFSILTTYMMFSQLLPIWYENLPHETIYAVPRMNFGPWRYVSFVLLGVIYLGPLVLLLTGWAKRTPWFLTAVSTWVLAGLWLERVWLISPSLQEGTWAPGVPAYVLAVAFAAALAIGMTLVSRRLPAVITTPGEKG